MAEFSGDADLVEVLGDGSLERCFLIQNLLLLDQLIVSFDLLSELCIGGFELVGAHVVLFDLELDFFELVHGQVPLLLHVLMHVAFVKHVDPVLLLVVQRTRALLRELLEVVLLLCIDRVRERLASSPGKPGCARLLAEFCQHGSVRVYLGQIAIVI